MNDRIDDLERRPRSLERSAPSLLPRPVAGFVLFGVTLAKRRKREAAGR